MGSVELTLPQGPHRHCGLRASHPKHSNINPTDGSWCDGIPPLRPFVELSVRVPMDVFFGKDNPAHSEVLAFLHDAGLGMLLEYLNHPDTRNVLRVRAGRVDAVYPLQHREGSGFRVVIDDATD